MAKGNNMDIRCKTCGNPMQIHNSWDGIVNVGIMKVECTKCGISIMHKYESVEELDMIWGNTEKEINEKMK